MRIKQKCGLVCRERKPELPNAWWHLVCLRCSLHVAGGQWWWGVGGVNLSSLLSDAHFQEGLNSTSMVTVYLQTVGCWLTNFVCNIMEAKRINTCKRVEALSTDLTGKQCSKKLLFHFLSAFCVFLVPTRFVLLVTAVNRSLCAPSPYHVTFDLFGQRDQLSQEKQRKPDKFRIFWL